MIDTLKLKIKVHTRWWLLYPLGVIAVLIRSDRMLKWACKVCIRVEVI